MPAANFVVSQNRLADDEPDHVDSTSSTPPGAVTPRPDLTDKRLPGIIHSCFSQVGNFLRDFHPETHSSSVRNITSDMITTITSSEPNNTTTKMPPTPPSPSISSQDRGNHVDSPRESEAEVAPKHTHSPAQVLPISQHSGEPDRSFSVGSASSFDFCLDPALQTPSQRTSEGRSSASSQSRLPVSSSSSTSVVAYTSALATLFTSPFQKKLKSDSLHSSNFSRLSQALNQSTAALERERLTEGVSSPAAIQSTQTPPQTPRTRSREDQNGSTMTTPTRNIIRPITTDGTTVGPVLGKLSVEIREGRGLRPSIDPYVVCEFQLSQYISEGPVAGGKTQSSGGAVAIHPAAGDRRRPMAIPMRSRQSSNSGRDANTNQEVTNPRWDHKAVL